MGRHLPGIGARLLHKYAEQIGLDPRLHDSRPRRLRHGSNRWVSWLAPQTRGPRVDGIVRMRAGADCGHESVEQKRTAGSGCWRAFTSNWREITRYDPPFRLDISVGLTREQAYMRAADQNGRI